MPEFKKTKPAVIYGGKIKDTSWNTVAGWYDELLQSGEGTYQSDLILPNVLRLLELKKGEKIVDIACGQGFFSREFFKLGVSVTGIDLSPKLIEVAKERSPKEINFAVSSADKVGFLENESFDAGVCILAIQNIKNVAGVFAECSRIIKNNGRLIVVMNHPSFRIAGHSEWGVDLKKKIQYRRVEEYISESESAIKMRPGLDMSRGRVGPRATVPGLARTNSSNEFVLGGQSIVTVSFHRPLQFYFKALFKAGFSVMRLEEWTSNKQSQLGPNSNMENKARKEFPLFLTLEARKP